MKNKFVMVIDYRYDEGVRPRKEMICPCLTTKIGRGGQHLPSNEPLIIEKTDKYRIRKLTPLEAWRLMGFTDRDFEKAKEVNTDGKLYKQAGNSIVVNVLEAVFRQLVEVKQ